MATKKKTPASVMGAGSVLSSVSGPSTATPPDSLGGASPQEQILLDKVAGGQQLAADMPFNANKKGEHGEAAREPQPGRARLSCWR